MGVLLQGFFKLPPNNAVPSPADGDNTIHWWWDRLAMQANDLRTAGFTAVWIPPVLKSASGSQKGADGYGPFDDYDLGSKNQKGSIATRFGVREQLQRSVAIMRANGLDVYVDLVEHHRSGDPGNFVFRYLGANGQAQAGRFPKDPKNFRPNVPQDPHLGGAPADDKPFGRELAPINAIPKNYVSDNLTDAADWLTRALDVQGYRLDDVKGLSTDFLHPFLQSKSMAGKFAVGEFFDGNRLLVNGWIFNPTGMQGRPSAFDFPLRFMIEAMCANPGGFNMASLDHAGLTGISPLNSVTFVENHDTDLGNDRIIFNKILGYALILTSEGYPSVYYRDYSTDPDGYGLKPRIDNLIWIHENLAAGPTQQRWLDFNLFAYERLGGPHLLVALNNDPNNARTITVATGFGSGVGLHDYTGHSGDVFTDGNGNATITVPRNNDGLGYVCYSRNGIGGNFDVVAHPVTQVFEGAADLDIPPAESGKSIDVSRIWSAAAPISAVLTPDTTGWTAATTITLDLIAPGGASIASQTYTKDTPAGTAVAVTAGAHGFYTLRIAAANTPAGNAAPSYRLAVTYTATQQLSEADIQANPSPGADITEKPAEVGQWTPVFDLPNVPIHAHVLPNGKVLMWGRRDTPTDSLDVHECTPFVWDPATHTTQNTPQPTLADGTKINLFCSGHTFLPDGRLLVIGGHLKDSNGLNQSCLYDWTSNTWTASGLMNAGRWYPTAVTLPDGTALASSGSFFVDPQGAQVAINNVQQIWDNGVWRSIVTFNGLPLFPRMHVAPDGRVFMSGTNAQTFFLDTNNQGDWTPLANGARANGARDYAPSVLYDAGKVVYIGGGNNPGTLAPTNAAEMIDLNAAAPAWKPAGSMEFPRRQHNATILPDGTVFVTGGTRGGGGPGGAGFNDLTPGQPVHAAELWNPNGSQWTTMASEDVDRCYHSTAVLLPDATVLSGGGGEYLPVETGPENDPKDSHRNAQIYSPPYLFRGARPAIAAAPPSVHYGETFEVSTPDASAISLVSWVRLPSVTHSFDQNQRINFLPFTASDGKLTITAPASADACPPGHYMLFILNAAKTPSVASIIQITPNPAIPAAPAPRLNVALNMLAAPARPLVDTIAKSADVLANATGTKVAVGITPACPYGISACWGGAYEALNNLQGVDVVQPIPDPADSIAYVYLQHDGLPDVENWPQQFAQTANGTYRFRGVEVTLSGGVVNQTGQLILEGDENRPPVLLAALTPDARIQWDHKSTTLKPAQDDELSAYDRLLALTSSNTTAFSVTGPLKHAETGFVLLVRKFEQQ